MFLILNSLALSLRVTPCMILPILGINLASIAVWTVLGIFTLGLAGHVSEPITSAFIGLSGMRAELKLKGDSRHTDYRALALYSVMYGLFSTVALWCLTFIVNLSAILFALWQVGEPLSWNALHNAAKSTPVAFALIAVGSKLIVMLLVLAFYAVMAVRMAGAAQSAGLRAPSHRFFNGFGRSFIPLFLCLFHFDLLAGLFRHPCPQCMRFPFPNASFCAMGAPSETMCNRPRHAKKDILGSAAMGPPCKPETRRGGSAPF